MDISGRTLWQVGAGDTERSYADLCIKHGVMLIGPGDLGSYEEKAYAGLGDIRNSIKRFYEDARRGDLVLLRLGTGSVRALGVIADDAPKWNESFDDIDGWDLQHVRRVQWLANTSKEFPAKTLGGQVRSFASVSVPTVLEWVQMLPECEAPALPDVPAPAGRIECAELGRRLFIEGMPGERVERVLSSVEALQRIALWYTNELKRPEGRPSEHETVAYLILPLLFALGWSQQTAAVEWRNIDVALFGAMPANDNTLTCVVEAKLLGRSVFSPFGQAQEYALRPGREKCTRLIVTDGIRYAVHAKDNGAFRLHAYLNLLKLQTGYPILDCKGAVEAILGMSQSASI